LEVEAMKKQLDKMVGQVIALHTAKGIEVGVLEKVTSEGVILRKLAKKDAKDRVNAENVYFGGGYFPYRGMYGYGYPGYGYGGGYGGYGYGGIGAGIGIGVGVGIGAGFGGGYGYGYRPGFFW
jgi:hypothetical protein